VKRYQFRLETVLRLRRAEEEQAQAALRGANNRLRQLLAERDTEADRYRRVAAEHGATSIEGFRAEQLAAELAARSLAAAGRAAATAAADAALAQVHWMGTHRALATLERLEARHREEYVESERRAESVVLDDIATAAFVRERAAAGAGSWS
jgi:flagellar FliJ protein